MILRNATNVLVGTAAVVTTGCGPNYVGNDACFGTKSIARTQVYWNSTSTLYNRTLVRGTAGLETAPISTLSYATGVQETAATNLNASVASCNTCLGFPSACNSSIRAPPALDLSYQDLTFGSGDVYTTISGIAVAHGTFTPTRIQRTRITITSTLFDTYYTLITPSYIHYNPTPSCNRTHDPDVTSSGQSGNAGVPQITPLPLKSAHSREVYHVANPYCWPETAVSQCAISGKNVQLFYFPAGPTPPAGGKVVFSYAPNVTFTSPSIYVKFDELAAIHYSTTICRPGSSRVTRGCGAMTSNVSRATTSMIGTEVAGAILTLAAEDMSTLILDYGSAAIDSVASLVTGSSSSYLNMREGLPSWSKLAALTAQSLDVRRLLHPEPTDYYLHPNGAPGCDQNFAQPQCSTIFEGEYRPVLSLPNHMSLSQPAWDTCFPAIYDGYNPPVALTAASLVDFQFPESSTFVTVPWSFQMTYTFSYTNGTRLGWESPPESSTSIPVQSTFYVTFYTSYSYVSSALAQGPHALQEVATASTPIQPPTVSWSASAAATAAFHGVPMALSQTYIVAVPHSTLAKLFPSDSADATSQPRQAPSTPAAPLPHLPTAYATPTSSLQVSRAQTQMEPHQQVPQTPGLLWNILNHNSLAALERSQGPRSSLPTTPTAADVVIGARLTLTVDGHAHAVSAVGDGSILIDGHSLVEGNTVLEFVDAEDLSLFTDISTHNAHGAASPTSKPRIVLPHVDNSGARTEAASDSAVYVVNGTTLSVASLFVDHEGNTWRAIRSGDVRRSSASARLSSTAIGTVDVASTTRTKPSPNPKAIPSQSTTTTSEGRLTRSKELTVYLCWLGMAVAVISYM